MISRVVRKSLAQQSAAYHIQIAKPRALEILSESPDHSLTTLKHIYNKELYTTITTTSASYYLIQTSGQRTHEYIALKTLLKTKNYEMVRASASTLSTVVPSLLIPMCFGPLSLIFAGAVDGEASSTPGSRMKYVVDLCQKSGGKMCLLGGVVDGESFSKDGIVGIMHLPGIDVMRSELVAVLGQQARTLVGILGRQQEHLVSLLERRE